MAAILRTPRHFPGSGDAALRADHLLCAQAPVRGLCGAWRFSHFPFTPALHQPRGVGEVGMPRTQHT